VPHAATLPAVPYPVITAYDYTVIGFYVVFMLCLGVVFKG